MAWTTIAKRAVGACIPKSWLDTFIDNLTFLYNAIGGSGGSASNGVPNSSFENDVDADGIPDGWTRTLYTAGSGAIVSTDSADAKFSYKFTHPGGAGNGGGYLTSDYVTWSPYRMLGVVANLKCSAAGIKVIVRVKFYDKDKAFLSNTDIYTSTANPLVWTLVYGKNIQSPVTARFAKLELHGGVDDTDVAGDIYFDFAQIVGAEALPGYLPCTQSTVNQSEVLRQDVTYADVGSDQSIVVPVSAKIMGLYVDVHSNDVAASASVRARIGATYSTVFSTTSTSYVSGWIYLDVTGAQGARLLRFQLKSEGAYIATMRCLTANVKWYKTGRIVSNGAYGTQIMDAE